MNSKRLSRWLIVGAALVALLGYGCPAAADEPPLRVVVGMPPLGGLVERIAGARAKVEVLLPPGQACVHDFALAPRQVRSASGADALVTVGVPFEARLAARLQSSGARVAVIEAAHGLTLREESRGAEDDDRHAAEQPGAHRHEAAADPHVWLSPAGLHVIAKNIAEGLIRVRPACAEEFRENLTILERDIDGLREKLARQLTPLRGRPFYTYHPAFGYLADAYGLEQVAIESADGQPPTAKRLRELMHEMETDHAQGMLVESEASAERAKAIAVSTGCELIPIDLMAKDPLKTLADVAEKLPRVAGRAPHGDGAGHQ